jgi:hypothetical protein
MHVTLLSPEASKVDTTAFFAMQRLDSERNVPSWRLERQTIVDSYGWELQL